MANAGKDETAMKFQEMLITQIKVDHKWNNRVSLDPLRNKEGKRIDKLGALDKGSDAGRDDRPDAPERSAQEVADLAKLIKQSGNFTPISVNLRPDGTYFLVAGFRRIEAAKILEWTTVPVSLRHGLTPAEEITWNLLENLGRKDLNTFETARGCVRLSEAMVTEGKSREGGKKEGGEGVTGFGTDIGRVLDLNKNTVNLYLRIWGNVDPSILKAWEQGDQKCTLGKLDKLAAEVIDSEGKRKTGAALAKAFERQRGIFSGAIDLDKEKAERDAQNNKDNPPDDDDTVKKPSTRLVNLALAATDAKMADAEKQGDKTKAAKFAGIIEALHWAIGKRDTVAGLNIEKEAEKLKAKKAADAAKPKKKDGADEDMADA